MVHQPSEKSINDGLKLARSQFGTYLEVKGSEEFIEKTIQVLVKSKELADINLANPDQQQRLEETKARALELETGQPKLSAVERAQQWLENKETLKQDRSVPDKQVEQQYNDNNLSAVERAKQLLADKQIRSTQEIAKELAQEKEQKNQQKLTSPAQDKAQEKEIVQEKQLEQSKGWGMSR